MILLACWIPNTRLWILIGGFYRGGRSWKGNLIFILIDASDVNDLATVAGKDWARCCSLGLVGSEKVGAWSIVSMTAPSPGNVNDCKKNIISVKYKVAETNSLGLYGSLQHALLSFVIRLAPPPSTPPTPPPHTLPPPFPSHFQQQQVFTPSFSTSTTSSPHFFFAFTLAKVIKLCSALLASFI